MDSTTAIAIGAGSTIGLLLLLSFLNIVRFGFNPAYPAGPNTGSIFDYPFFNWFQVLYYFLPYGLFLFGVIYDGLIRKIKFFPAGFVGLGSVLINHILSTMFSRSATGNIDTDTCGVPGMAKWGSDIAPQNITFTSAVLSYLASYITASQSDSQYSGIAWAGMFSVWLLQTIMFNVNGCDASKPDGWAFMFGVPNGKKFIPPLIGLASGMLYGGLAGFGFSKLGGGSSGIDVTTQQTLVGGKGPAMAPTSGTAGAGKCSPTSEDDQFVCEAYKNGELVTSTIVE